MCVGMCVFQFDSSPDNGNCCYRSPEQQILNRDVELSMELFFLHDLNTWWGHTMSSGSFMLSWLIEESVPNTCPWQQLMTVWSSQVPSTSILETCTSILETRRRIILEESSRDYEKYVIEDLLNIYLRMVASNNEDLIKSSTKYKKYTRDEKKNNIRWNQERLRERRHCRHNAQRDQKLLEIFPHCQHLLKPQLCRSWPKLNQIWFK